MRNRNKLTPPPLSNTYSEWLRYMVQSIDPDAGELPFLVTMWGMMLTSKDPITQAQADMLQPYIEEANLFLQLNIYPQNLVVDMTNVIKLDPKGRK